MKKVCLSGSTRYKETFLLLDKELSSKGCKVLRPTLFSKAEGIKVDKEMMKKLIANHNKKIEESDSVVVICEDYHLGRNSRNKMEYALSLGKKVFVYNISGKATYEDYNDCKDLIA